MAAEGWASSRRDFGREEKHRKTAFTLSTRRRSVNEGSGDDSDNPKAIPLRQLKSHTTLEIESGDNPSRSARHSPPTRMRSEKRKRHTTRQRFKQNDDEDMGASDEGKEEEDVEDFGSSDLNVQGETTRLSKTSTALLLAEEASQILGTPVDQERNYWSYATFAPVVLETQQDLEARNALLFYPESIPVPESERIEDLESRVRDDEGLFVGEPVPMSQRNWNRLYWRLLKENAKYWFEPNGKMCCHPDPYRKDAVQLFREDTAWFLEEDEDREMLRFVQAKLDPFMTIGGSISIHPYELEVDLGYVNFLHHPYFSKEHVIAAKLHKVYEAYSNRLQTRITERSVNKLKALREAVAYTKTSIEDTSQQLELEKGSYAQNKLKELVEQLKERLHSYREEMRKVSLARDQGYWDDKASITAVLDIWKKLKSLRDHQGYTNTSLRVNIIELPSDPNEELERWVQDIEADLNDVKEEGNEIFEVQMARYNAKMKRWSASSRNRKREASGGDNNNGTEESEASVSIRPKPPQKPSLEECRRVIEKRYKEIRHRPGEPHIVLELNNNATITQIDQLPEQANAEKLRRRDLKKCKVELMLWLNGNEIFRSKPRDISQDFTVFMGYKVPISSNEKPELLELEIVDLETKIRTLRIPIDLPDSQTSIERCKLKRVMFFADDVIKVSNAGVGSGVQFEINGKEYGGVHTKGDVTTRCGWAVDAEGNIKHPKARRGKAQEDQELEMDLTRKMSAASLADPNNPKNASKFYQGTLLPSVPESGEGILQDSEEEEKLELEHETDFMVDRFMAEFNFCDDSVIDNSARLKLLLLRDEGVPEFKNIKMVSSNERDISLEVFLAYERRLHEDQRKRLGEKGLLQFGKKKALDDAFVHETDRLERIKEIRLGVLRLFEKSLKQITFEDLVVEEQIPDIGTLGLNLMAFFQPRRPLRPIRKERKRVQASNLVDTSIDLVFNIVRAFNLPWRKDSDVGLISTESLTGIQLQKKRAERGAYSTVRPFVEVWFQRKKVRTTTALGSNPTWNQELQINIDVPNDDYSQANMSKMDDCIFLIVYDEVPVDLLEDDRRRETDIHQRIERRWLGSLTIPFATLYTNGRIEGTFRLCMPPVLLGYEPQGMTLQYGGISASKGPSAASFVGGKGQLPVPQQSEMYAFLTIFITLQPAVQPLITTKEDSGTGESSEMMAYVKNWKHLVERKFRDRSVRPFVMTPEGDTILCTRYITTLDPPEGLLAQDGDVLHKMETLAHYVSLFPFVRDSTLGITDYSLWITSDVFVSTPGGGVEDHAVLLACYFHYLNIPCWTVQGNAIPDGPTTFVVTSFKGVADDKGVPKQMKNAVLVWNPCTGDFYNANDNFCPLQSVWSAIGKHNVWANVSEFERPYQMDWSVGKSNAWLPLFPKPMTEDKIPCVQPAIKKYKTADQNQANSLAQRIERNLKDVFMKWRSSSKTNWNRYCSSTLRRLLPKLEENKAGRTLRDRHQHTAPVTGSVEPINMNIHPNLNEEHLIELREVMASYQMSGFPLQQPYVNMHTITESVFATGLHTIDTPDVEFALAAYAQAYPASVYSVWVYVAALHRRK